jgi:hypothetical protein
LIDSCCENVIKYIENSDADFVCFGAKFFSSEKNTIRQGMIDLSVLLARSKIELELDETHHRKNIKDNYFYEITRNIRNLQKLSPEQMEYIRMLPIEKQTELLELYNECIGSIRSLFL